MLLFGAAFVYWGSLGYGTLNMKYSMPAPDKLCQCDARKCFEIRGVFSDTTHGFYVTSDRMHIPLFSMRTSTLTSILLGD